MEPRAYYSSVQQSVRFQVSVGQKTVTGFARRNLLSALYGQCFSEADAVWTLEKHEAAVTRAVMRRIAAGAESPVHLTAEDFA